MPSHREPLPWARIAPKVIGNNNVTVITVITYYPFVMLGAGAGGGGHMLPREQLDGGAGVIRARHYQPHRGEAPRRRQDDLLAASDNTHTHIHGED